MAKVFDNPTPEELRTFTEAMPEARLTEFGNLNVQTKVLSRSAGSTYVVERASSGKTMTRAQYDEIAALQDAYLAENDVIVVDGFIGNDPEMQTAARLVMEKRYANIAGMQQKLYFERRDGREPEVQVIYTPGLVAPGYPDDRVIAVDLDHYVTRVLNSDYFGESKKGGLRMWNDIVYGKGGLALHAGLKVIPTDDGDKVFMIIGSVGDRQDDDDVHDAERLPSDPGRLRGADAGRPRLRHRERMLREDLRLGPELRAVDPRRRRQALRVPRERVSGRRRHGSTSSTSTTRRTAARSSRWATCSRSKTPATSAPSTTSLILNRNENIIPAVAKLSQEQAAAYFMLGETTGTSPAAPPRRASSCASRGRTRSSRSPTACRATASSSCSPRTRSRRTCSTPGASAGPRATTARRR